MCNAFCVKIIFKHTYFMFMNYIERDIGRTRIENAFRQCQGQREGKKRHVIRYWTIPLSSGSSAKVQNEGFFLSWLV